MLVFLNGNSHPIGSIAGALVGAVIIGFIILLILPKNQKVVGFGEPEMTPTDWFGCFFVLLVIAAIAATIAMFVIAA